MVMVWILEYEECNGEYGERLYIGAFSSEKKAMGAFDVLLDKELLKGEDAINEWRTDENDPNIQEFRTGNWGFCIWKLSKLKLDEVGKTEKSMGEQWHEEFGDKNE